MSRIRIERERKGMTQAELAEASGVSLRTLSRIETENKLSYNAASKIGVILGVSTAYLLGETDNPMPFHPNALSVKEDFISPPDYNILRLPVLSMASVVCAGDGYSLEYVDEEIDGYEILARYELGPIDETQLPFVVRVEGDSMEGAGIYSGAKVVINPAAEVRDGNTALVCYGIDRTRAIKWVYWPPKGGVEIRSANPNYGPRFFDQEEIDLGFFFVIGRVMKIITEPIDG